ncbi:hypothetical protein NT2_04_04390 [Caenibius tardaugens NBRC 16725]|uniref:Uncharacterized protein n=1 Tax=Caenibius tardaugens NBRC 16725 TaxID=1219035 RepID=U2Y756_9SPHN|nr:DUF4010 domain-containing protein [Caenibius tardaugens]AZI35924.1 DUF4010 domain-containing protein [Caenibius tardaugens NBRC 16725]GAD49026.1 hypothetical protein NT2_04_04390 [Caenibius tardaugens NBRC 16725]
MFANLNLDHAVGIAIGFALGLLVGIQRGWALRDNAAGTRFAGIRTYALMGLAGAIAGMLYQSAQGPATVLLAAAALLMLIGYARTIDRKVSGTGTLVGLLTLACGFLAGSGEHMLGIGAAVAMVLLLALRNPLHGWVSRLSEKEVLSIARFAVIALVILPLLPDKGYGPYNAWNPRQLWMVVVMVSGFSFAGYFATKALGTTRGLLATAAAGSMVSSTAVTADMAGRMREGSGDPTFLSAAIAMASLVMFLRVNLLVGVLAPFALAPFAMLTAPAAVLSVLFALWFLRRANWGRQAGGADDLALRNPFDIGPALLLTVLVMVLTVAAHWVLARFGDQGLATVLAISGTVDVDSAIITMGSLPQGTLAAQAAALVLAVPVTLNTLFKGGVALSIAGWPKGRRAALPLAAVAVTVIATALLSGWDWPG